MNSDATIIFILRYIVTKPESHTYLNKLKIILYICIYLHYRDNLIFIFLNQRGNKVVQFLFTIILYFLFNVLHFYFVEKLTIIKSKQIVIIVLFMNTKNHLKDIKENSEYLLMYGYCIYIQIKMKILFMKQFHWYSLNIKNIKIGL